MPSVLVAILYKLSLPRYKNGIVSKNPKPVAEITMNRNNLIEKYGR